MGFDFRRALAAVKAPALQGEMNALSTVWGESLDRHHVLEEQPHPQCARDSFWVMNGEWDYAIVDAPDAAAIWPVAKAPEEFEGIIVVPFSPESALSGVGKTLQPTQLLWYRRTFNGNDIPRDDRYLLHFEAVDYACAVYVNGVKAGQHVGGYEPFSFDITDALVEGDNEVAVCVFDPSNKGSQLRGKQHLERGGIWYTPQSGIWQTVWAELVPERYIESLLFTPELPERRIRWQVFSAAPQGAKVSVCYQGEPVAEGEADADGCGSAVIAPEQLHLWTPETPELYDVTVTLGDDTVKSYFARRTVGTGRDAAGHPCLLLNGEPYFHHGVLDQGYWPDGLYTAPSDEALIYDITLMKRLGFNMLRKHIKIEPMRWYYHCDRLGMLVWQDMPCGGRRYDPLIVSTPLVTGWHLDDSWYPLFGRTNVTARKAFLNELRDMVTTLYNHPCIAVWVPFNEGWGQFDSQTAVQVIRSVDKTRTIDPASGWHDQGFGDVRSLHVYFQKYRFRPDKLGRATLLSEFGGYVHRVEGHAVGGKSVGYKTCDAPLSLEYALQALYDEQIRPAIAQGLSAAVYTQLSDVEHELNGLVTYDRSVVKLPVQTLRKIFYIENE